MAKLANVFCQGWFKSPGNVFGTCAPRNSKRQPRCNAEQSVIQHGRSINPCSDQSLSLSLPHGVIGAAPWPSAAWTLRGFSRLGQTLIDLRADLRMRLATRWNRSSCNVLSGSLKEKKAKRPRCLELGGQGKAVWVQSFVSVLRPRCPRASMLTCISSEVGRHCE